MMRGPIARIGTAFKRLAACRRGGTGVEMGIVLPVLIAMIVGAVYAGWLLYSANVLFFAVEQAARCAALNAAACKAVPNGPTQVAQTQAYAVSMAFGLNVTAANFTVTPPGACGWRVSVINYTFPFLVPFQSNFNVSIPATACYPAQPS
jgi:Flp pilus assembly protein TadG